MLRICFCLWFVCSFLYSVEGKILLEDGKSYEGKFEARPLYFKDIFRNKKIKINIQNIYSVRLLTENLSQSIEWGSRKEITTKKYILAITTKDGHRYWGRIRWVMRFIMKNGSTKSFVFPYKQNINQKRKNHYALNFTRKSKKKPPKNNLPSIEGKISPLLHKEMIGIYALHHKLGIFFRGGITTEGYIFQNILPGVYDLVIVSKKGVIFYLTMSRRQSILDGTVDEFHYGRNLEKWIESHGNFETRYQTMFYTGHLSDSRVLIMKKDTKSIEYFLWICKYNKNRQKWTVANRVTLYSQEMNKRQIPRLFVDRKLGKIKVGLSIKRHDYLIDD